MKLEFFYFFSFFERMEDMKGWITILFFVSFSLFSLDPVIVLMGPPGSGKGTFSQHLKEKYGYNHISCGDLVRQEIENRTSIGQEIEETVKSGHFISSEIMNSLLGNAVISCKNAGKPLIIDGFVRKPEDLAYLTQLVSELRLGDFVLGIMLKADNEICRDRILQRQICKNCGHVYNKKTAPSIVENECDLCNSHLKLRMNDYPQMIEKRIVEYREMVERYQDETVRSYPHLTFETEGTLESCLKNYSKLAEELSHFSGTSADFVLCL